MENKRQRDEHGNIHFDNLKCCICLEVDEDGWVAENCVGHFKCYTCVDGYVCNNCISEFDPQGSIYMDDLDEIKETITCPCCRTENWKYHFNQIICQSLDGDFIDNFYNGFHYKVNGVKYSEQKSLLQYMKYYDPEEYAKIQTYYLKDICMFCDKKTDDYKTTNNKIKTCLDCRK
jgi:hypothetical protein